ncbi:hypothetical protein M3Y96_01044700 [Aphelenchoides besseyi]|nr:hypothetical protein M3Y96_01044700 [Aphelenchoides besseyi]
MAPRPLRNKKETDVPESLAAILQRPLVRPVNLENLVRKEYDRRGRKLPLRDAKGRFISTYQAYLNEQIRARTMSPATTQESSCQFPNDRPFERSFTTQNKASESCKTNNTLDTVTSILTDIAPTQSVSSIAMENEFSAFDQTQLLDSATDDDEELIQRSFEVPAVGLLTEETELPVESMLNSLTESLEETQAVLNTTQSSVQSTQSEFSIASTTVTSPLIDATQKSSKCVVQVSKSLLQPEFVLFD